MAMLNNQRVYIYIYTYIHGIYTGHKNGDDGRMVYGFGYCPHESHIYFLILDCEKKNTWLAMLKMPFF